MSLVSEISEPPVISTARPRYTRLVASVARNECTRSPVITSPLVRPSPSPTSGAVTSPSTGSWCSATHAAEVEATAKIAPVDRSKPPETITNVPAIATIASGAFWVRMLSRLRVVRNASLRIVSAIISTTMRINTP